MPVHPLRFDFADSLKPSRKKVNHIKRLHTGPQAVILVQAKKKLLRRSRL
jgi:hypothetical protein